MAPEKKVFRTMESALFAEPHRAIVYPEWDRADRILTPTAVFPKERGSCQLLSLQRRGVQLVNKLPAQVTTTMVNLGAEHGDQWEKTQKEINEAIATYLKELDHSTPPGPESPLGSGMNIVDEAIATYLEEVDQSTAASSSRLPPTLLPEAKFKSYPESDISIDFREESQAWAGLKSKAKNDAQPTKSGEGFGPGRGIFHCNFSNVRRVSADPQWMRHVLRNIWKPDPQQFQLPKLFDIKAMQLWIVTEVLLAEEITITAERDGEEQLTTATGGGQAVGSSTAMPKRIETVLRYGNKGFSFPFAFRVVIASFNSMTGEFVQGSLRKSAFGTPPLKHLMATEWDVDEFEWDLDEETLADQMVEFANAVKCEFLEVVDVEGPNLAASTDSRPWLWLGVTSLTVISAYHTVNRLNKLRRIYRL